MATLVRDINWYRERDAFVAGYIRGVLLSTASIFAMLLLLKYVFP